MGERPLPLAAVFSIEGETLSHAEKTLFSASQPFGFILFGRNCKTPAQLEKLTDELRSCVGWDCPIMIDQEGGRVARLRPPHWDNYQPARFYGEQIEQDANAGKARLEKDMTDMAKMLMKMGIDVNCAPVMDVLFPETHAAIGDRAFSGDPSIVFDAAETVCLSFLDQGVTPVIKHLPGHGRAGVDSHYDLPVVDVALSELITTDFAPFSRIAKRPYAPSLWGMVAHIIYPQLDPDRPSSISPIIINDIIRKEIGFDGLLFSDDLDMKALEKYGSIPERARESLQAGCDLALYCWAKLDVMEAMAATLPPLSAAGWKRWENSLEARWTA